jgi:hypothetical protein
VAVVDHVEGLHDPFMQNPRAPKVLHLREHVVHQYVKLRGWLLLWEELGVQGRELLGLNIETFDFVRAEWLFPRPQGSSLAKSDPQPLELAG